MSYRDLLRDKNRILPFGVALTFLSGFGQTYLISLYTPHFIEAFNVSQTGFGAGYSVATLTSAALLPVIGRLLDRASLRRYTLAVLSGLIAACLIVAVAPVIPLLLLGIFGLRFTGQGLLGHVALTTAGRSEGRHRGRILSVASLGYPLSEAILPISFLMLISWVGWRWSWVVTAAIVAATIPFILHLTRAIPSPEAEPLARDRGLKAAWSRFRKQDVALFTDPRFFLSLPAMLVTPTLLTGLFLYQVSLSERKGWDPQWLPSWFVLFAVSRTVFSLFGGPWIDRVSAVRLFAVHLLPLALGILTLAWMEHPAAAGIYLALAGLTVGFEGPLKSAIWAEIYGTRMLATIRSYVIAMSVFGTALSPPVFGWALERGISLDALLYWSAAVVIASATLALLAMRIVRPQHGAST